MDIQTYLKRLNLNQALKVDLDTLITLHRAHAFTIPFENFNVRLEKPISIEPKDIFEKLILNNRGGYCYELNILFAELLKEIGFKVTPLIGRPLYGYNNALRPRTHMILKVHLHQKNYLCDLGFGGKGLIEPIELVYGQDNEQFGEVFSLANHPEGYELQCKIEDEWLSLYSFDLTEQSYIDYELANFYNMSSPDSRFTQQIICAKPTPQGRILLLDKTFKYVHEGKNIIKTLDSIEEYEAILHTYFNIDKKIATPLFQLSPA